MEFKSLTNIETSFRQLRTYAFVFAGICAVVTVTAVWMSYSFAERQRQKIYVLDNGRSLMVALSQDLAQNRPNSVEFTSAASTRSLCAAQ